MNPPVTIVGRLTHLRVFRRASIRATVFGILVAVLLLLSFFPERYRAATSLTPTDPNSLGLGGTLGQLGAINSVFGNQTAVEVALRVGRSVYVRDTVIDKLKLEQRLGRKRTELHRWLEDEVEIRSLRGGIIQLEMLNRDAPLARDIVAAFGTATQERLAEISRRQTEYKRDVLIQLVGDASDRLARARGAYDSFRLQNQAPLPEQAIKDIGSQIPLLESEIKAKEVELAAARQGRTDENFTVRQLLAQIGALRSQLAAAKATGPEQSNSVGQAVRASTQGQRLYRELSVAQSLYDSYMRYLEGTAVEDLTSTASVRVLEPPFVDTERQIDYRFLAAAIALALLWGAIEIYRLRPPVGDRIIVREQHA